MPNAIWLNPCRGHCYHATRTQANFIPIVAGENEWQADETRFPATFRSRTFSMPKPEDSIKCLSNAYAPNHVSVVRRPTMFSIVRRQFFRANEPLVDFVHFLFWHDDTCRVVSFHANNAWMLAFPSHTRSAHSNDLPTCQQDAIPFFLQR